MKNPWKTVSSKIIHTNKYFQLREDEVIRPNGEAGLYQVVETPGSVAVIALNDEQKFSLIGQFRYPTGNYSLELPSGGREYGSRDPLFDAKRELLEETGITAREWSEIGRIFPFNGLASEEMVVYIARDLKEVAATGHLEEGIMEVRLVSFDEAFVMIRSGQINDAQTSSAIMQAALYMGKIKVN